MPLVNIFSIAYQEKFTKYGAHREKLWYSPSSIDTYFDDTLELDHINDDIMWDDAIWVLLTSSTYNYQKSPFIMDLIKRYKNIVNVVEHFFEPYSFNIYNHIIIVSTYLL